MRKKYSFDLQLLLLAESIMKSLSQLLLSFLLLVAEPSLTSGFKRLNSIQRNNNVAINHENNRLKMDLKASNLNSLLLRGGYVSPFLSKVKTSVLQSPSTLFNGLFLSLAAVALVTKIAASKSTKSDSSEDSIKPEGVKTLQAKFLVVFWLMRMADWLQGPYFYEVYSSKIINGLPVSLDLVSKIFLVGFATTGVFGPFIGRFVDTVGRKAG
jgi:hypothetical protein